MLTSDRKLQIQHGFSGCKDAIAYFHSLDSLEQAYLLDWLKVRSDHFEKEWTTYEPRILSAFDANRRAAQNA